MANRIGSFVIFVLFFGFQHLYAFHSDEMCMRAKVINIEDTEIAYYESRGKGPTVVLLHGNSMSSYGFSKQLCGALGSQYHVVAIDLPGHGRSSNSENPSGVYNLPWYAGILVEFVKALGIEDSVYVGWSLGGHVLLEASEALTSAKGMMIFGTPPLGVPPAINDAFLATNPGAGLSFQYHLSNTELERYVASLFAPDIKRIPDFFYKDVRRTDPESRLQLLFSVGTLNYSDEIAAILNMQVPLAIIHGEEDQAVSLEYIQTLDIPTLWRGKVQIIKQSGHSPQWESPEAFDAILRAFIRDLVPCYGSR